MTSGDRLSAGGPASSSGQNILDILSKSSAKKSKPSLASSNPASGSNVGSSERHNHNNHSGHKLNSSGERGSATKRANFAVGARPGKPAVRKLEFEQQHGSLSESSVRKEVDSSGRPIGSNLSSRDGDGGTSQDATVHDTPAAAVASEEPRGRGTDRNRHRDFRSASRFDSRGGGSYGDRSSRHERDRSEARGDRHNRLSRSRARGHGRDRERELDTKQQYSERHRRRLEDSEFGRKVDSSRGSGEGGEVENATIAVVRRERKPLKMKKGLELPHWKSAADWEEERKQVQARKKEEKEKERASREASVANTSAAGSVFRKLPPVPPIPPTGGLIPPFSQPSSVKRNDNSSNQEAASAASSVAKSSASSLPRPRDLWAKGGAATGSDGDGGGDETPILGGQTCVELDGDPGGSVSVSGPNSAAAPPQRPVRKSNSPKHDEEQDDDADGQLEHDMVEASFDQFDRQLQHNNVISQQQYQDHDDGHGERNGHQQDEEQQQAVAASEEEFHDAVPDPNHRNEPPSDDMEIEAEAASIENFPEPDVEIDAVEEETKRGFDAAAVFEEEQEDFWSEREDRDDRERDHHTAVLPRAHKFGPTSSKGSTVDGGNAAAGSASRSRSNMVVASASHSRSVSLQRQYHTRGRDGSKKTTVIRRLDQSKGKGKGGKSKGKDDRSFDRHNKMEKGWDEWNDRGDRRWRSRSRSRGRDSREWRDSNSSTRYSDQAKGRGKGKKGKGKNVLDENGNLRMPTPPPSARKVRGEAMLPTSPPGLKNGWDNSASGSNQQQWNDASQSQSWGDAGGNWDQQGADCNDFATQFAQGFGAAWPQQQQQQQIPQPPQPPMAPPLPPPVAPVPPPPPPPGDFQQQQQQHQNQMQYMHQMQQQQHQIQQQMHQQGNYSVPNTPATSASMPNNFSPNFHMQQQQQQQSFDHQQHGNWQQQQQQHYNEQQQQFMNDASSFQQQQQQPQQTPQQQQQQQPDHQDQQQQEFGFQQQNQQQYAAANNSTRLTKQSDGSFMVVQQSVENNDDDAVPSIPHSPAPVASPTPPPPPPPAKASVTPSVAGSGFRGDLALKMLDEAAAAVEQPASRYNSQKFESERRRKDRSSRRDRGKDQSVEDVQQAAASGSNWGDEAQRWGEHRRNKWNQKDAAQGKYWDDASYDGNSESYYSKGGAEPSEKKEKRTMVEAGGALCFHCHQPGHWKGQCPVLYPHLATKASNPSSSTSAAPGKGKGDKGGKGGKSKGGKANDRDKMPPPSGKPTSSGKGDGKGGKASAKGDGKGGKASAKGGKSTAAAGSGSKGGRSEKKRATYGNESDSGERGPDGKMLKIHRMAGPGGQMFLVEKNDTVTYHSQSQNKWVRTAVLDNVVRNIEQKDGGVEPCIKLHLKAEAATFRIRWPTNKSTKELIVNEKWPKDLAGPAAAAKAAKKGAADKKSKKDTYPFLFGEQTHKACGQHQVNHADFGESWNWAVEDTEANKDVFPFAIKMRHALDKVRKQFAEAAATGSKPPPLQERQRQWPGGRVMWIPKLDKTQRRRYGFPKLSLMQSQMEEVWKAIEPKMDVKCRFHDAEGRDVSEAHIVFSREEDAQLVWDRHQKKPYNIHMKKLWLEPDTLGHAWLAEVVEREIADANLQRRELDTKPRKQSKFGRTKLLFQTSIKFELRSRARLAN